jgi:hypothetical protein
VKFAQTVDELLGPPTPDDPTGVAPESWANEGGESPNPSEPGGEE